MTPADKAFEIAEEMRETFNLLSPFIEKHTSIVCPDCDKVCCAERHGCYDGDDIFFLKALGIDVSQEVINTGGNGPCRFISEKGCVLERWKRPFRCTHFFCDALLKSLENDNAKLYRAFVEYFRHLIRLRQKLTGGTDINHV